MRRLLVLVGAVVSIDTLFYSALTPMLPHFASQFGFSVAEAGLLVGGYAAGALVGGIPGGISAARLGVKPTVLLGLASMATTTILFGFAGTSWLLLGARFLQGCASAFSWTGTLSWLVAAAPARRRGEMIGRAMGAAIFGALFGPALGALASTTSVELVFLGIGLLAAGLGVWAWRTPAVPPTPPQPLRLLLRALRDPATLTAGWFVLLPGLFFGTLGVLAPLRLSHLGWGALAIGATWLAAAVIQALIAPTAGRISDRRGAVATLAAGLLGSIAVTAAIPWLPAAWTLALFVLLGAVAYGVFWAPATSLLGERADALGLEQAYGFALVNVAWAPGAVLGAAAGGAIAHASTDTVPYLIITALCVLTLGPITRLRRTRPVLPAAKARPTQTI